MWRKMHTILQKTPLYKILEKVTADRGLTESLKKKQSEGERN